MRIKSFTTFNLNGEDSDYEFYELVCLIFIKCEKGKTEINNVY